MQKQGFMQTMGKATCMAHANGKNYRLALKQFLLNYRANSHSMTGASPAELLFHRSIRTKLAEPIPTLGHPQDNEACA